MMGLEERIDVLEDHVQNILEVFGKYIEELQAENKQLKARVSTLTKLFKALEDRQSESEHKIDSRTEAVLY